MIRAFVRSIALSFLVWASGETRLTAQVVIVDYNPAITALTGVTAGSVTPSSASVNIATPLSGMALSRGAGLTATSASNAYSSSGFSSTTLAAAITANQYYTMGVNAPIANYALDINGFTFTETTSSTGPTSFNVLGSVTGFGSTNSLQNFAATAGSTNTFVFNTAFGGVYSNLTASTSFRIYGLSGATAGTFRINAFQTSGLVSNRWTGTTSGNLSDATNYVSGAAPGSTAGVQFEGSSNTSVTVDSALTIQGIRFAAGAAAFTLDNTNQLTLSGGGIANYSSNMQTINTAMVFTALQGLGSTSAGLVVNGTISGAGGIAKTGPGTVTVNGLAYTGNTQINAGTLKLTTTALPSTTILGFTNTSAAGTLDMTGFTQSVAGLTFGTQTTGTATILGDATTTLTTSAASVTFAGANTTGNTVAITMETLGGFTYSNAAGSFTVANGGTSFTGTTAVTLANATGAVNTITAATVNVGTTSGGDSNVAGGGNMTTLNLGPTNIINATTVNIGTSGSRASGKVQFAAGLTSPSVAIAGSTGGSSTANLNIGSFDNFASAATYAATLDTTAGTLTGQFATILMGREVPTSSPTAARSVINSSTFAMGAGTVNATAMTLGSVGTRTGGTATFTYTFSDTSLFSITNGGTANIGTVTLATSTFNDFLSASTNTLNSQISIINGTLNATSITRGTIAAVSAGTWTVTTQINFTSGTLGNIAGNSLTVNAAVPIALVGTGDHNFNISGTQTATIGSVISGTGSPITKTGSGTLILNAVNTYTGATVVNAGTLGGTGTVNGSITVASGGTVRGGSATAPAGTLSTTSAVTFGTGSILGVTIVSAGAPYDNVTLGSSGPPGTTNNLLSTTGTLSLPSGLTVAIDGTGAGFIDATTYSYKIASAGSVVNNLASTTDIVFAPTGFAVSSYSLNTDATGVYINFTAVVPEPGTILGLCTAGLCFAGWLRRRRAAP